jgi:hypothetical protein
MEKHVNHDRTITFALAAIVAITGVVAMVNSLSTTPIVLPSLSLNTAPSQPSSNR